MMNTRHRFHPRPRLIWLLALGVVLFIAAAPGLRAQDETATEEPTPFAVMTEEAAEPEAPLAEVEPLPTDPPAEPSPEPTLIAPTEVAPPVILTAETLAPTDTPPTATAIPTDVLPVVPDEVALSPAAPSAESPTESSLPLEATAWPTEFAATPAAPTTAPVAIVPNLQLVAGPTSAGERQSVLLVGNALGAVASLALNCQADPAHLQGTRAATDGLFTVAGTLLDTGFQPSGQWLLVWSRTLAEADSPSPTVLLQFDFQPLAAGATTLACQVYAGDAFGTPLADVTLAVTLTTTALPATDLTPAIEPTGAAALEMTQEAADEATLPVVEGTAEATPERLIITPDVVEFTPEANAEATAEPERVIVTPEVTGTTPMAEVRGQVASLIPLADARLIWEGDAMQQSVSPEADGSFHTQLLAGVYRLTVTAPRHLPYSVEIAVEAGDFHLPPITLHSGDIDGNGQIDNGDVDLLVASFGQPAAQGQPGADLNADGLIDLYDLAILGANLSS